jgi:mRNA-degrading endonuclease RelE of RelBE toxin-antitoxin system
VSSEIICSNSAAGQLRKLNRNIIKRIVDSISNLKDDPEDGICRIANSSYYKLRVGDFRVIFDIEHGKLRILAVKGAS